MTKGPYVHSITNFEKLTNRDTTPMKKVPDQDFLRRIAASKIRQGRNIFQVTERNLKQRCSKTVGTEFETIYKAPTKHEDYAGTDTRRKWMRRRLKKFEDEQGRLREEEYNRLMEEAPNGCVILSEEEQYLQRLCNYTGGLYRARYTPPPMGELWEDGEGRRMLMRRKLLRHRAHLYRLDCNGSNIYGNQELGRMNDNYNLLLNPTMWQLLPEPRSKRAWRVFEQLKSLSIQVSEYERIHGIYGRTDPF